MTAALRRPSAPTTRPTSGRPRAALPARPSRPVPLGLDRSGDVRQAAMRSSDERTPRRRPRPLLGHFQQRPGPGPSHAGRLPGIPRRGGRQGFPPFFGSLRSQRPAGPLPDLPRFINDMIVRTLAGVAGKARPIFLKVVYHGPAAMEQLAGYDSRLIVGILGGSSGTTFDAFQQLWEARIRCPRALYGRMINNSEHQGSFIEHLRAWPTASWSRPRPCVLSRRPGTAEYRPYRSLEDDLQLTLRTSGLRRLRPPSLPAGPLDRVRSSGAGFLQNDPERGGLRRRRR